MRTFSQSRSNLKIANAFSERSRERLCVFRFCKIVRSLSLNEILVLQFFMSISTYSAVMTLTGFLLIALFFRPSQVFPLIALFLTLTGVCVKSDHHVLFAYSPVSRIFVHVPRCSLTLHSLITCVVFPLEVLPTLWVFLHTGIIVSF